MSNNSLYSPHKGKVIGHLAAAGAYTIFGFNIIACKDIANSGAVSPELLFLLRAIGASTLFWLISLFMPEEKIDRKDMWRVALASMLGLFVPQFSFLEAITMTTPVDSAVLGTLPPIFTMLFAAVFLKEPITLKKAGGVFVSLAGVLCLIFNSVTATGGAEHTRPLGIALMILNGISFGAYLGVFRPLIARYSVVTFMKWMFLFAMLYSLPVSGHELLSAGYSAITLKVGLEIAFVIVFATFAAYFLIPVGQKRLRPTLVSMYTYLQPVIASGISIGIGMDVITWQKTASIALIFGGVALVSRSRAAAVPRRQ